MDDANLNGSIYSGRSENERANRKAPFAAHLKPSHWKALLSHLQESEHFFCKRSTMEVRWDRPDTTKA